MSQTARINLSNLICCLLLTNGSAGTSRAATIDCKKLLRHYTYAATCVSPNADPGKCGNNILQLLLTVEKLTGGSALDIGTVLFIRHKNFKDWKPQNIKEEMDWRYHVVLETKNGIWDFDSRTFLANGMKPVPKERYFADVFGRQQKEFNDFIAIAVPARRYLENYRGRPHTTENFVLPEAPAGWALKHFEQAVHKLGATYFINLQPYTAEYYLLTAESSWEFPSVSLAEYLKQSSEAN